MTIPAWVICTLAFLYSCEYIYRFFRFEHNYIYLGKALGRLILSGTFLYIFVAEPPDALRSLWVRWSLFMLLGTDLFYIAQEHLMRRHLSK
jgi:hypothetical protein